MKISKKEEQHTLGSPYLHEVEEWQPPNPRRRKPPAQLDGQLDLVEACDAVEEDVA